MLVQECLVQGRCTLGEWPERTIVTQEVEPTISVFQMTPSTTPSTHIPQMFTLGSMAQNTNIRFLVVMITMYHVLFAMLQQGQLK